MNSRCLMGHLILRSFENHFRRYSIVNLACLRKVTTFTCHHISSLNLALGCTHCSAQSAIIMKILKKLEDIVKKETKSKESELTRSEKDPSSVRENEKT